MRGGFGPRFVVEAIFLVAVATIAGLAQFPTEAIVLVMALAWLLVAGVEWALARVDWSSGRRRPAEEPEAAAQHVRVVPRDPEPEAQPVLVRRSEPLPEPELEAPPAPEPISPAVEAVAPAEPVPADELEAVETVVAGAAAEQAAETEAPEEVEPEPEPESERPPLVAVAPEPEPPPEPELAREPPDDRVVALPLPQTPRAWNLWELERLAREGGGADTQRDEERAFLLMYLRDYASPEGTLPVDFDLLVRESFGELIEAR